GISTISGFAAVVVPGDVAGDGDAVFDKFPGGFALPPKTPNIYAAPIPTTPSRNSTNNPAIPKIKGEKNDFFRGCEVTETLFCPVVHTCRDASAIVAAGSTGLETGEIGGFVLGGSDSTSGFGIAIREAVRAVVRSATTS